MNYKRKLEKVIKAVQLKHGYSRTKALHHLAKEYDLCYVTLFNLGKRGKVPTHTEQLQALHQMIKDFGFWAETTKGRRGW